MILKDRTDLSKCEENEAKDQKVEKGRNCPLGH